MVSGETVIAEARRWIGTAFMHQGRLLGAGVDCAGLVICVARELGLSEFDVTGYARQPDGATLERLCDENMARVPPGEPTRSGDVLFMRFEGQPQHLAFVSGVEAGQPAMMLHAYAPHPSRVVEHRIDAKWRRRIVRAYRIPGVA